MQASRTDLALFAYYISCFAELRCIYFISYTGHCSLYNIQVVSTTRILRCIRLYYISDQSFFLKISVKVFLKDIVASQRPIKNINTLIVAAYFYLQFPALPLKSFSIYDPMQQYLTRNTGISPRVFHFKGNLNFVYTYQG